MSKLSLVCWTSLFRRVKIHLSLRERSFSIPLNPFFLGLKSAGNWSNANLTMFHSLLQNSLYPTTCLTSRLIELYTMYARRVKRKASVPQGGIPSGNFADCKFKARFFSFSGKFEFANLSSKVYRVHPSVTSRGSITFPFDLDIFYPSSSRTIGWRKTVWNVKVCNQFRHVSCLIMTIHKYKC